MGNKCLFLSVKLWVGTPVLACLSRPITAQGGTGRGRHQASAPSSPCCEEGRGDDPSCPVSGARELSCPGTHGRHPWPAPTGGTHGRHPRPAPTARTHGRHRPRGANGAPRTSGESRPPLPGCAGGALPAASGRPPVILNKVLLERGRAPVSVPPTAASAR